VGFSIWVVDGPELEGGDPSDFPYFSTTNSAMSFIRVEMEDQGMLTFMPFSDFAFNNGDLVPSDEIAAAHAVAAAVPRRADADEAREIWDHWLKFLGCPSATVESGSTNPLARVLEALRINRGPAGLRLGRRPSVWTC
jgi:hypothetical protein